MGCKAVIFVVFLGFLRLGAFFKSLIDSIEYFRNKSLNGMFLIQ